MGVFCGIFHPLPVTGQAGIILFSLFLEPVTAARGVTVKAVKLARPGTGAHTPEVEGVVFS